MYLKNLQVTLFLIVIFNAFLFGETGQGLSPIKPLNTFSQGLSPIKPLSTISTLTITAPNGGENWQVGSTQNITWTSSNITNVKLEYTTNNGTNWTTIITSTSAGSGSYAWTIPNTPSSSCKVKLSDATNSAISDVSNTTFTISSVPTITVTSPNGGESWQIGTTHSISWSSSAVTNVKTEYTTNNGTNWTTILSSITASFGYFDWKIPNTPSTNCKIRVSDIVAGGPSDESNATFVIPSPVNVVNIKFQVEMSEQVAKGRFNPSVNKVYLRGSFNSWGFSNQMIKESASNIYTITLSLPTNSNWAYKFFMDTWGTTDQGWELSIQDRILAIQNIAFTTPLKYFNDELPAATIQIVSPNGGENWTVGEVDTIKWTSTSVDSVKIEVTTNNGTSWATVKNSIKASLGTFAWIIPNTPSTYCKIKISDVTIATIGDTSNTAFSIKPDDSGYDTLTYAGKLYHIVKIGTQSWLKENLDIGTMIQGTTNPSNNGTIEKYCYKNDPTNCATYGGLYQWNEAMQYVTTAGTQGICPTGWHIPTLEEFQTLGASVSNNSNALKAIGQGTGNGAGTNTSGFSALFAGDLNVTSGFISLGEVTYLWSSTENASSGYNLTLYYNDSNNNFYYFNKGNGFSIRCLKDESVTATIQIISPNGGENLVVGTVDTIKWQSTNVTNVKLEYTTDNGTSWLTIIASIPASTGTYAWTIPNTPSTNCKVKISDVSNSNIVSLSNFVFTIAQPTQNYFSDGFENGLSNWIVSGQDWGLTNTTSRGGSYCITESPNGNYGINGNFIIVLANAIDLSTSTNPILTFWHKYYSEFYDYCRVDISKDGGTTWSELEKYNYTQNSWTQEQLDLSSYKVKNIKIRFRFTSDAANNYDGWYIDDVEIKENNLDQKLPFPFSDGFENGLDNWIVSGKDWGRINTESRSGSYCITESPVGTYSINSNVIISLAKTIDLSTSTNPILTFWHKYYSEFYDYCRVDISKDGGNTWAELKKFNYTQNSWTMEQLDLNNYKSKYVKIRFRFTSDLANNYDGWYIDDVMVQDAAAKYTLLTSPNGGENWQAGSTQNITWTSANVTNVKLEYTTDNGTDWISIVATTPASAGSYAWTIPNTPSTQCKVKISDVDNSLIADTSGIFTIAAPTQKITVTSPNGGENWNVGSTQNIIWTSNNVTNVKLEYTTDSGTSWSIIIASTPASVGSYPWIVPNVLSAQCKVRVSDASQSSIYDLSDSAFVILDNKIPNILVSVNSLDFGNVYIDSTSLKQINLTNTGTADLQIQSTSFYQASSAYKVNTFNQTIKPDSTRNVSISFTPTQIVSYPDTLYVYHNATGNPSKISLSGSGIDVAKPVIKIAVTSITFDTTYVGSNNQKTLSITNEGTADLVVSSITANKAIFTSSETSFIVGAGLNHLITLTFSPTSDSGYSGTLAIQHNALGSPSLISLTGKGKKFVPNIVLSSKEINFGVITVNSNYETSLLINNTGTVDLVVTNIHSSNSIFVTVETNFMVAPNSIQEVHLKFTPLAATQYTGTLTISHNAESGVTTIPMTGAGYPVQVSVTRTFSFGDITRSGNYRLVGLPGNSNIPITQTVSGAQKTDWNAYYDNGILSTSQSDYLKEYDGSPNFMFKPGNGFWIISKNGFTVSANVAPVLLAADSTYAIPLQANWNIISNPFEKSTSWTKIKQLNGLTTDPLYKWNGQTYDQVSEVTTYEGFYFLNNKGLSTLKIPYDANGTLRKFFKEKDNYLLGERGFIINCFDSGVEKSFVYAGFNTKASNDVDDYDYFMPPVDFGEVSLVLQNDSLSSDYKKLMIEQRKEIGDGTQFDFTAKNISKDAVQLSVNGFEFFPESETYLLDKQYNKFTNLKEKNVFVLPPQMGKRGYSLLVGNQAFIQERKAAITPKEYLLYQNYPNPFNPATTIAFGLPKESNVTLTLYNTLGEVVLKNELGGKASGYHELLVDLRSNPSGVYFYRLSAESLDGKQKYSSIKKMILLK